MFNRFSTPANESNSAYFPAQSDRENSPLAWLLRHILLLVVLVGAALSSALILKNGPISAVPAQEAQIFATATATMAAPDSQEALALSDIVTSPPDPLTHVLRMSTVDVQRLRFTHWEQLKDELGATSITGQAMFEARRGLIRTVVDRDLAPAAMDREFFILQAKQWGWDSTDLVWEASLHYEILLDQTHILRFRPDFDLSETAAALPRMGFTSASYDGTTLYSAPMDGSLSWSDSSPLALHNVAILPAEGLLIASASLANVQQVLDVRAGRQPALAEDAQVIESMGALAGATGVQMQFGATVCQPFSPGFMARGGENGAQQIEKLSLQPYTIQASGIWLEAGTTRERLIFQYGDAVQADADFSSRYFLLIEGSSMHRQAAYGELFEVVDSRVFNARQQFDIAARAELAARPGWPQTVTGWLLDNDALFSACGGNDIVTVDGMR